MSDEKEMVQMIEKIHTKETGIMPTTPMADIKDLILPIKGFQVLLDSDVAMLYGYDLT